MSKRKKNNVLQRTKRVAAACLKDCAVAYVSGNKVKHLVSLKHEAQVKVTPNIDKAVHGIRWRWTVLIAAFCRGQDGKEYVKQEELAPAGEYFYHELTDTLNDLHLEFLEREVNKNHIIGVGWLAIPRCDTIDEAKAERIFSMLGAFNYLANWEAA